MSNNDIQSKIQVERDEARAVCEQKGDGSIECAVAWEAVEELQAEASHQRQKDMEKNSLQEYCDANPEAAECRVYDN